MPTRSWSAASCYPDPPTIPWILWILSVCLLLVCIGILSFVVLPQTITITKMQAALEQQRIDEEKYKQSLEGTIAEARKRVIRDQQQIVIQQDKVKKLTEENLKLAELLNKSLKPKE